MIVALSLIIVILSVVLTRLFCVFAKGTRLMDKPNERSLHSSPTVRGGGLVFIGLPLLVLPFVCYLTGAAFNEQILLVLCIIILATISFLDDLYHLSVKSRFFVQALVAGLIALFMSPSHLDFVLFSLSNQLLITCFIFFMVLWAINHFNFMDGLDGFCASQAIFLFVAYSILFGISHAFFYQEFCYLFIFSLTGFLLFNLPPAKLFMGDIGSATLGLVTFCIAVIAQKNYQIPILYWFILNGLFLFDSTITLLRRIINKEQWSTPHRKHAYQRLKQTGVSTHFILSGQMFINVSLLVLVLVFHVNQFNLSMLLLLQVGFMLLIYYLVEKSFPMFR